MVLCHKLQELITPQLLAQHDFASSVAADDVEPALAEIDSQRDRVHGSLHGW